MSVLVQAWIHFSQLFLSHLQVLIMAQPFTKLPVGLLGLMLWWLGSGGLLAQENNLRQGRVFTEPEAKEKLAEMATQIPDVDAWRQRAELIRENILRGAQLEHLPPACDLNPIRHSRRELDGYSVENVAFEALPGFFVTGNLYLPLEHDGKIPGILAPHGHAPNGRRLSSTQQRCAAAAKMGAAVFAWDMLGFGESQPCPHKHEQSLRIQTYSSMRALDYLLSLGFVDEDRIAVTGASGGGTQSFILSAVDPRVDVSAPVVQVSAHFYGGCECESGMPVHVHNHPETGDFETNNVEFAASFAPKPQIIVSDGGDWTANVPEVEFPYIQRIYTLMGAQDKVENAHFADEGHDYGPSKRHAVYRFFSKHLGLDLSKIQDAAGEIDESTITVLEVPELAVFDDEHPRPEYEVKSCVQVIELLDR